MAYNKNTKNKRRYRLRLGRYIPLDAETISILDKRIAEILAGTAKFCRIKDWDTLEFEDLSEEECNRLCDEFRKIMKKANLNNDCVGMSFEEYLKEKGMLDIINALAQDKIDLIEYYDEQNNLGDDY